MNTSTSSKKNRRALCFCLTALLAASAIVSCGSTESAGTTPDTAGTAAIETASVTEAATEERLTADLPEADFDGYVFHVVHWELTSWTGRECKDIYAEAENGDVLNDAVYTRNMRVFEKYNFSIQLENIDHNEIVTTVKNTITAGDDAYDLAYIRLYEAKSMMTGGYFCNFYDIPYIDMSKPWWDANCAESMSIGGKLYFAASDINIEDKNATASILFNKAIAKDYDIEDLYALVKEGKWTIDKMQSIYKNVTKDVNGDGVMDETDLWGFLGGNDVGVSFYLGGEGTYISKDEDGNLTDSFNTEYNIALSTRIQELMCDTANFYNHHTGTQKAAITVDDEYRDMFANGAGLFYWARLDDVTTLRSLETDFGILPTPKYEEAQEQYASLVSQHITALMTVPATATNLERTGIILEALAAESKYTVQPAYYEVALKSKYLRDDESADMLDLIFANRKYDFGEIFDLGGWSIKHLELLHTENANFISSYEKNSKKIGNAITKLADSLAALE